MAVRPGETEDLASLTHLNEAILLDELKARYKKDDIYVRIEQSCFVYVVKASIIYTLTRAGDLYADVMILFPFVCKRLLHPLK